MDGGGHGHLGQPAADELKHGHLRSRILHAHAVRTQAQVRASTADLLPRGIVQVTIHDLLRQSERPAEPVGVDGGTMLILCWVCRIRSISDQLQRIKGNPGHQELWLISTGNIWGPTIPLIVSKTKGLSYSWVTARGHKGTNRSSKVSCWTMLVVTSQRLTVQLSLTPCHWLHVYVHVNLGRRGDCCWPPAHSVDVLVHLLIVNAGAGLKAAHGHLGLGAEGCGDMKPSRTSSRGQLDQGEK